MRIREIESKWEAKVLIESLYLAGEPQSLLVGTASGVFLV